MANDPGTGNSWGRRLICAFGAAAVGLLGVMLLVFVLSQFDGATRRLPEWLILSALLLTFLGVGIRTYKHLCARDHYVLLALLYSLPALALVSVALLREPSHYDDYPADASAMMPAPPQQTAGPQPPRRAEMEREQRKAAEWQGRPEATTAHTGTDRQEQEAMEARRRKLSEQVQRQQAATQKAETPEDEQLAAAEPRTSRMPRFPWPPPKASGMEVLPTVFLHEQVTLGDVAVALDRALSWIGRHEIRFYWVPNGFAMVTRLEAIDEDGNTVADADRDHVDFLTYIRNLFWVPPGHYRMIVFVVTDQLFESAGAALDRAQADDLLSRGFNDLPQVDRRRPYTDKYRTTALIYEFRKQRRTEVAQVLSPGRFPAHYHLDKIGWFAAAQVMPQTADMAVLFPSPTAAGRGRR